MHEPIVVTAVMADTARPAPTAALPSMDMATTALYGTVQFSDVPMSSLLPQSTPSTAGTAGGRAYREQYGALMPQNMYSAPAQGQALPTMVGRLLWPPRRAWQAQQLQPTQPLRQVYLLVHPL